MQEYACVYNLHVHENNYNYHKCYNIEGLNATHNFFACIDIRMNKFEWINHIFIFKAGWTRLTQSAGFCRESNLLQGFESPD